MQLAQQMTINLDLLLRTIDSNFDHVLDKLVLNLDLGVVLCYRLHLQHCAEHVCSIHFRFVNF